MAQVRRTLDDQSSSDVCQEAVLAMAYIVYAGCWFGAMSIGGAGFGLHVLMVWYDCSWHDTCW